MHAHTVRDRVGPWRLQKAMPCTQATKRQQQHIPAMCTCEHKNSWSGTCGQAWPKQQRHDTSSVATWHDMVASTPLPSAGSTHGMLAAAALWDCSSCPSLHGMSEVVLLHCTSICALPHFVLLKIQSVYCVTFVTGCAGSTAVVQAFVPHAYAEAGDRPCSTCRTFLPYGTMCRLIWQPAEAEHLVTNSVGYPVRLGTLLTTVAAYQAPPAGTAA